MLKPRDYDNVKMLTDFQPLPAGGYVCRIKKLEETKSKNSGRDMIKIALDIAEGEEAGRFEEQFRNNASQDKKWPASGIMYQLVEDSEGKTSRGFKTFVEHVRESNAGFEPQWNEAFAAGFKDKLIGAIFRREEFKGMDGRVGWTVKVFKTKNVEDIRSGNFKIPDDKPLEEEMKPSIPEGFEEITDDDIPF